MTKTISSKAAMRTILTNLFEGWARNGDSVIEKFKEVVPGMLGGTIVLDNGKRATIQGCVDRGAIPETRYFRNGLWHGIFGDWRDRLCVYPNDIWCATCDAHKDNGCQFRDARYIAVLSEAACRLVDVLAQRGYFEDTSEAYDRPESEIA